MPTLGTDCHITLTHPLVNSGSPYGFLLDPHSHRRPPGVMISREVVSDDLLIPGGVRISVSFDVLMADLQVNPDGSAHTAGRMVDYARLLEYLDQADGLDLETTAGTLVNLGALGYAAVEKHGESCSLVRVSLTNAGYYFPPVSAEVLNLSVWDGTLNWTGAYWR